MTDPTPAATARDALVALHDFLWDEMEWFSDESAPMPRYTTMAHGQKHDDLVERFHDAYPELLAAAEATPSDPVARAEAMVPAWMLARTYSLLPVDRVALVDDEVNEAIARYLDSILAATAPTPSEPVECVGCAEHGIHHPSGTPITHSSSAPAPTPSEPVARCGFTTDGFRCNDTPLQHRYLCGLLHSHTFVCHPFTPGARDE